MMIYVTPNILTETMCCSLLNSNSYRPLKVSHYKVSFCVLGHLDSKTSIQRVLLVTFSIALVYSSTQVSFPSSSLVISFHSERSKCMH